MGQIIDFGADDFGDVLPAGKYVAELVGVKEKEVKNGKNAGAPLFACDYKITQGDNKNKHIFDNLIVSEKMQWRIAQFLQAAGVSKAELRAGDYSFEPADFIGTLFDLTVEVREASVNAETGQEYDESNQVKAIRKHIRTEEDDLP